MGRRTAVAAAAVAAIGTGVAVALILRRKKALLDADEDGALEDRALDSSAACAEDDRRAEAAKAEAAKVVGGEREQGAVSTSSTAEVASDTGRNEASSNSTAKGSKNSKRRQRAKKQQQRLKEMPAADSEELMEDAAEEDEAEDEESFAPEVAVPTRQELNQGSALATARNADDEEILYVDDESEAEDDAQAECSVEAQPSVTVATRRRQTTEGTAEPEVTPEEEEDEYEAEKIDVVQGMEKFGFNDCDEAGAAMGEPSDLPTEVDCEETTSDDADLCTASCSSAPFSASSLAFCSDDTSDAHSAMPSWRSGDEAFIGSTATTWQKVSRRRERRGRCSPLSDNSEVLAAENSFTAATNSGAQTAPAGDVGKLLGTASSSSSGRRGHHMHTPVSSPAVGTPPPVRASPSTGETSADKLRAEAAKLETAISASSKLQARPEQTQRIGMVLSAGAWPASGPSASKHEMRQRSPPGPRRRGWEPVPRRTAAQEPSSPSKPSFSFPGVSAALQSLAKGYQVASSREDQAPSTPQRQALGSRLSQLGPPPVVPPPPPPPESERRPKLQMMLPPMAAEWQDSSVSGFQCRVRWTFLEVDEPDSMTEVLRPRAQSLPSVMRVH